MNFILKVNVTLLKKDLSLEVSIEVQSFSVIAINLKTKKNPKTSTNSVSRL